MGSSVNSRGAVNSSVSTIHNHIFTLVLATYQKIITGTYSHHVQKHRMDLLDNNQSVGHHYTWWTCISQGGIAVLFVYDSNNIHPLGHSGMDLPTHHLA